MDTHDWDRIKTCFGEAVELTGDRRERFLERACAGDAELRAHVDELLVAHDQAAGFLESTTRAGDAVAGSALEEPGTRVGPYELVELLGEGGFGAVYRAEQQSPVRRHVALKILKPGMDTRAVIARFEAERQALALMEHPHIAKVFDAGTTDAGRPYFAMELVDGVPITEYCDAAGLSTAERLELFVPVCHAVQHAHGKGVIHRDIKPGNVLVTLQDGAPVPKVIDFGIAKATEQRLTERTFFTELGQLVGTPEYMSPEQAEANGLDVDERTDIYSLGVLLYELLTGATPFEVTRLRDAALADIQRIIRDEDPPKPSDRLSTLADVATVAERRCTQPAALGRHLRGDLDWIVMKALEKDRGRRYGGPDDLAADVRRHLASEPVQAGPPTRGYRLRKYVRRHRSGVALTALAAALVLVGAVGTAYAYVRANAAREQAQVAYQQALVAERERHLAETSERAATGFLVSLLSSVDPEPSRPPTTEVLDSAVQSIDERDPPMPTDEEVAIRTALAQSYRELGEVDSAQAQLEKAVAVALAAHGEHHVRVARARATLAQLLAERGSKAEAIALLAEAVPILEYDLGAWDEVALAAREMLMQLEAEAAGAADR